MANKQLIVSLVSDQTIPNVQIIKHFWDENSEYLFITSDDMRSRNIDLHIKLAAGIEGESLYLEKDRENDTQYITKLLNEYNNFEKYEKIIVNITGGTKIMSNATYAFFNNYNNVIIVYVDRNNKVLCLKGGDDFVMKPSITVREFMLAYGNKCSDNSISGIDFEQTKLIYEAYKEINPLDYLEEFNILRERRKAGRGLTDIQPIIKFIEKINYQPQQEGHLTKDEVKYLTGEWFEEYVYYTLKEELQLSDEQICIGIHLDTDRKIKHPTNPPIVEEELKLDNELDVVFVKNDALHTIECKTSVWNVIDESKIVDGNIIVEKKKVSILGETIYKSDSLQQRFGLKPMTNIITLTRFSEDPQRFQKSLDRANLSGIKIINGDMLDGKNKLSELIK